MGTRQGVRPVGVGPLVPASKIGHPTEGAVWVQVDGEDRQRSDIAKLIWSVPRSSRISTYFELQPGDLVNFTGAEGVAGVQQGNTMLGGIDGLGN